MQWYAWSHLRRSIIAGGFASLIIATPASATQHLISPGDDWQKLNGKLKPGDEVILMPGKHRTAILDDLNGTVDQPIIIRGLDPKTPALIQNQRDGLRFNRPHHLVIKDITLSDCGLGGISVSDGTLLTAATTKPSVAPPLGPISISGVKVLRTGMRNDRDAMSFIAVDNLKIENCEIEGWNSSGIELVGCHDVVIDTCSFKGAEGFSPQCNIQVRAGSTRVQIKRCRFDSAARRTLLIGGNSKAEHFHPPLVADDKSASPAEASEVAIENCFIINSPTPFAFINADNCSARNCTIVRPRGSVFAVRSEQADPRILAARAITFGSNLVVWDPGDLQRLVDVAKGIPENAILIESNLWWSSQSEADRAKLGSLPGMANWPQTTDVDPRLDDAFKPLESQADVFGVDFRILIQKQP